MSSGCNKVPINYKDSRNIRDSYFRQVISYIYLPNRLYISIKCTKYPQNNDIRL